MDLKVKKFDELNIYELYKIMKLRVDVFVVEQNCPYQELDNIDQDALHIWFEEDDKIIAYLRLFYKNERKKEVTLGRVISLKRREGIASLLLEKGIKIARDDLAAKKIYLEAQTYAKSLYEKQGFKVISDSFFEDGIEHVKMILDIWFEINK